MKTKGFNWDEGNRNKCQKHGVSIKEIELVFSKSVSVFPDIKHSDNEIRYFAVGKSLKERYIFIVFTYRDRLIRPISARYMHEKEIINYKKYIK